MGFIRPRSKKRPPMYGGRWIKNASWMEALDFLFCNESFFGNFCKTGKTHIAVNYGRVCLTSSAYDGYV